MSQNSPRLDLPFIQPSQAQKHVTHNEALRQLDLIVQLSLSSTEATNPPAAPDQGDVYALGVASTGEWAGQDGKLAAWLDNAWHFTTPATGWRAWDESQHRLIVWDGAEWIDAPIVSQNLNGVGIATVFDETNRLSVRSSASLFSHDGAGHQLKINKASAADTASLLFQSNWTGHAEMGLSGSTGFSIKVSPDGGTWTEALSVDPSTALASSAAIQASPDDTTPGRLMRADFGYGPGNLLGTVSASGGVPTGAVIERGTTPNAEYIRFADGTQICTAVLGLVDCTTSEGALFASGSEVWAFPIAFASGSTPSVSGSGSSTSRFLGFDAPTETEVSYKVLSTASDTTPRAPTVTAIGRWN